MLGELGLLILRLVVGILVAGHGAQKLFGWFGGPGLKGFANGLASRGLRPALFWSFMSGISEFGGGLLLALGLLGPIGSFGIIASMLTAIFLVHWGKGIWNTKGGSELPLTNLTVALAIAFTGPGAYSLDHALGIVLPEPILLVAGGLALVVLGVIAALLSRRLPRVASQQAEHSKA